ncbi:type II toxin-antitoxin system RelE/ParE family toxin [Sphingobium sp.]|uniref:type II toxin-antitoxin system RelE/ParE family toxin n=1 Tax=Sphingobium sp. TaxID=1912891 RepID=UPI0025CC3500|nr:type II toxin-antitoxin system RelE/ParE family toxin [Sphingobium sp.]
MKRVFWSNDALADLEQQAVHIARDNPAAARRVAKRIREVGDGLSAFATGHMGRVAGTYEKSVARLPYVVAYALSENDAVVTILRVIHTSRDWRDDVWPG